MWGDVCADFDAVHDGDRFGGRCQPARRDAASFVQVLVLVLVQVASAACRTRSVIERRHHALRVTEANKSDVCATTERTKKGA